MSSVESILSLRANLRTISNCLVKLDNDLIYYETLENHNQEQIHIKISITDNVDIVNGIKLSDEQFRKTRNDSNGTNRSLMSRNNIRIVTNFLHFDEETDELFLYECHLGSKSNAQKQNNQKFTYTKLSLTNGYKELNPWLIIDPCEFGKVLKQRIKHKRELKKLMSY